MKSIRKSFLFFCFLLSLFLFFNIEKSHAQQAVDSLNYYSKLALQPQNANDLFKAEDFFYKRYKASLENNQIKRSIHYLYFIASIKYKRGAYDNSEETAVKALQLIDGIDNSTYTLATRKSFYNLLGIIYEEERNKDKALELYRKTLEMAESTVDSAIIYNNISVVFKNYKDSINAKSELLKAHKLLPRITDTLTQALILDNLGMLHNSKSADALPLIKKALELREQVKDSSSMYISYSHLAAYYNEIDDKPKSKYYALKALEFAKKLKSSSYKNKALGLLTEVSDDPFARAFKHLNDSIETADKENTNRYAMIRYDVSKKEKELLVSQRTKERLIIATFFIVLVFIFLSIYQKFKHKKDKLQEVYETESRISKRIHDEVANDLFLVMTKLENKDQIDEELKSELHSLYHKTRDISKEHDLINSEFPFIFYLNELLESFNDEETSVIVKGVSEMPWDTISELKKTTIYKVLQELLINMRKHSKASLVVIIFSKQHKSIHINYSDNGVGSLLKKHSGLQNTENRIRAINGTIIFDTEPNKGFKSKISV